MSGVVVWLAPSVFLVCAYHGTSDWTVSQALPRVVSFDLALTQCLGSFLICRVSNDIFPVC